MAELSSLGITSFTDAGVDREKWACYNDVYNESFTEGGWTLPGKYAADAKQS